MPSSNKTTHLQLNKWLGADKPKRDDFNNDNTKIDDAYKALSQSVTTLTAQQQTQSTASAQDLAALAGTVTAHTGNTGIHVTAAEKTAWSKSTDFQIGSYTGTGAATLKITLGFVPRFGILFAAGDGIMRANWSSSQLLANSGYMSQLGCSLGIALTADGFSVEHNTANAMDGLSLKYNTTSVKYIYVVWK